MHFDSEEIQALPGRVIVGLIARDAINVFRNDKIEIAPPCCPHQCEEAGLIDR